MVERAPVGTGPGKPLDNAVKYSDPHKEVALEAGCGDNDIIIQIRDQGYAIAPEHLPRLFERFYRVDKARSSSMGGTGLGLALVKHIINAHGGSISVQSTLNEGSVFTIALPLVKRPL